MTRPKAVIIAVAILLTVFIIDLFPSAEYFKIKNETGGSP